MSRGDGPLRRLWRRLRREKHAGWYAYAPMSGARYEPARAGATPEVTYDATYDGPTAAALACGFAGSPPEPARGLPDSARALLAALISAAPEGHPGRETLLAQLGAASAMREPDWQTGQLPDVVPHLHLILLESPQGSGEDAEQPESPETGDGVERVVPHQQTWPVHGHAVIGGIPAHVELQIVDGLLAALVLYPREPEDDPDGYDEELHMRFEAVVRGLTAWPDPASVRWEVEGTSGRRR